MPSAYRLAWRREFRSAGRMDEWIACKDKVLIPGDVVRWQRKAYEQRGGKWKEIGLLEMTGQVDEEDEEWLTLTRVDSVVLQDKTNGKKVHAAGRIERKRFKRETVMKGRPRRRPWKDGEDVRAELVQERVAEVALRTYRKYEGKV